MGNSIFIVSGEESGDKHGASLMAALKALMPSIRVEGMGGERMRREGLKGLDSREVSVVGLVEVIEKLPGLFRVFRALKERLRAGRFDAVVLIDLPDFNLRFAKEAKKLGIPIIYYISPQVWAWRKNRIKKIAALVDKMLVVFPFEVRIYRDAGVDVEYVGHPLAGTAVCGLTRGEARAALGIVEGATVVSLLPGSRTGEVRRMLGPLLGSAELIRKGSGGGKCVFLIPAAGSIDDGLIRGFIDDAPAGLDVRVVKGRMYEALRASDAAVVTSGTATLETALIGTPMVIVYRMRPLSYRIGRMLIGVENVGLPNIIAGTKLVPELLQDDTTPEKISAEVLAMLHDEGKRRLVEQGYEAIRESLGGKGAAQNAALAIRKVITGKKAATV
ncbi:MAG: lipid-A-disaccharide synthase [Thermodesulfobacteriota bacterium]